MNRRVVLALVALALTVRVAHFAAMRGEPFLRSHLAYPSSDQYLFDQWARRIAAGDWLGVEVFHPVAAWQTAAAPAAKWAEWMGTAPVFFKAPFYAYLIAALYRLWDDVTVPLFVLQVLVSAVAAALLAALTTRCFGTRSGVIAGVLFALYAPAVHFDLVMLRGPWVVLSALLVTAALMRLRDQRGPRRSLLLGGAVGFAVLVNEAFLVLPALLLPFLFERPAKATDRPWRDRALLGAGFAGGLLAVLSPLIVRNLAVGAPPFSLAVTGSMLAASNSAGSSPWFFVTDAASYVPILERTHGALLPTMVDCWQSFGGPARAIGFYLLRSIAVVMPFELPDNANFYYAALLSPVLHLLPGYRLLLPLAVLGLAMARTRLRVAVVWLPAALALLASMYVASPTSRYRATLAVMLMPFAGLAVDGILEALRTRRWRRSLAMLAAVAMVGLGVDALERHVVFAEVDADELRYRAPEFMLAARAHAERHDLPAAAKELLLLAQGNPDPRTRVAAMLILAGMAKDEGNVGMARAALAGAARFAWADAAALLRVGDAHRRLLGDVAGAAALYGRVERLDRRGHLRGAIAARRRALAAGATGAMPEP